MKFVQVHSTLRRSAVALAVLSLAVVAAAPAFGGVLVTGETTAATLATAVTASGGAGITVTGSSLSGHGAGAGASSGLYSITGGPATYGLVDPGIVLSTGAAANYSTGPNTSSSFGTAFGVGATPAQAALLVPVGGAGSYNDVTQLNITFDVDAATSSVFFNVVFGSEEFFEFVGSSFIDAFGLYINGVNVALTTGGFPLNINNPAGAGIAGTELDGVIAPGGNPLMTFSAAVTPGSVGNTLTFIVADKTDSIYDTTVYISALGGTAPPSTVPEPGSMILAGVGLASLAGYRLRRKKAAQ